MYPFVLINDLSLSYSGLKVFILTLVISPDSSFKSESVSAPIDNFKLDVKFSGIFTVTLKILSDHSEACPIFR